MLRRSGEKHKERAEINACMNVVCVSGKRTDSDSLESIPNVASLVRKRIGNGLCSRIATDKPITFSHSFSEVCP